MVVFTIVLAMIMAAQSEDAGEFEYEGYGEARKSRDRKSVDSNKSTKNHNSIIHQSAVWSFEFPV